MSKKIEDFSKLSRFVTVENSPSQTLINNYPVADFLGLTPAEMHDLIYEPFRDESGFKLIQVNDEILNQIPFFLLVEHLLLMIYRDKSPKLTPRGCLSTKYCIELLEKKLITESLFEGRIRKRILEEYYPSIESARLILQLCKLVVRKNNKLQLSEIAMQFLHERKRFELFKRIFESYSHLFSWAYLDGYSSEMVGQLGFAFSITLLQHYGNESQNVFFYFDKYKKAFPQLESHFQDLPFFSAERQYIACYRARLFERFYEWFGLARQDNELDIMHPEGNMYSKTVVVDQLFSTPELLRDFI
ncbi:MAG: hypothetical protein K8I03_09885 [Ignavibacteria bacterium]|nr:hypothetical protein [Ignavibacteria bacterium]